MSYPFHSAHAESPLNALSPVSVCGVEVSRDAAGRFSLNDLHRAAGGASRHRPNYWLGLDQTKALIEELKKPSAGIPVVDEIQPVISVPGAPSTGGGTFVRRELVYGYAMWISPAFHLTVIRTFDALMTASPAFRPNPVQGELFGPVPDPAKLAKTFGDFLRLAKHGGLDAETARRTADRLTHDLLGVSPLAVLEVEPTVAPEAGSEVLSMTELLGQHQDPRSARGVYRVLTRLGWLERRTVQAAGYPARVYPVLVGEGLRYGANVKAKASHLTSHPMFYPARFPELLARLAEGPGAVAEIPASLKPRPGEVLIPVSEWLKTRH
jgi:hypothetical protein